MNIVRNDQLRDQLTVYVQMRSITHGRCILSVHIHVAPRSQIAYINGRKRGAPLISVRSIVSECSIFNFRNRGRDGDGRELRAMGQRPVADCRHSLSQPNMSGNPASEMIVPRFKINRIAKTIVSGNRQNLIGQLILSRCAVKRMGLQHDQAMGQMDGFERGYLIKTAVSDRRNSLRNGHLSETFGDIRCIRLIAACTENIPKPAVCRIFKACPNERQRDFLKILTILECAKANFQLLGICIGNRDIRNPNSHKGIVSNIQEGFGKCKLPYARIRKGVIIHAQHAARLADGDSIQLQATVECKVRYLQDAVGKGNIVQALTAIERPLIYTPELISVGKRNRFKGRTVCERVIIDGHHTCGNRKALDILRLIEGSVSKGQNVGHGIKPNAVQTAVFKGTKAYDLHRCGNGIASSPSGRESNQLSAVLAHENTVHGTVVRVIVSHRKALKLFKTDECILTDIADVGRDIHLGQARVIERIAGYVDALAVSEPNGFQGQAIPKCTMIDQHYAVGKGHRRNIRACKRPFRNFGQNRSLFKLKCFYATLLKCGGAQGFHTLGYDNRFEIFRIGKRIVLDDTHLCPVGKNQLLDHAVAESLSPDKFHAGRNLGLLELTSPKGFGLNGHQGFGESDGNRLRQIEGLSSYGNNVSAEIQRGQIYDLVLTHIRHNGNIAAIKYSILEVALLHNLGHANVVGTYAFIPVFVQIRRHNIGIKIEIDVPGSPKCISSDMLKSCGNEDFRERRTFIKCKSSDIDHRFGHADVGEAFTETECKVIDIRHLRISEINADQGSHALKTVSLNRSQRASRFKGNALQMVATVKHIGRNVLKPAVLCERKGFQL